MDLTLKKSAIRRKLLLVINLLVESLWEQFLEKKKKSSLVHLCKIDQI
jgi:hypothetical protein